MKFIEKPAELLLSLLAIGVGAWIPTIDVLKDNDTVKIISTLFAVVGGVVLGSVLSSKKKLKIKEEQKWKMHFHDRIKPINRHLGSLTKEIYSTIDKVEKNTITNTEALRLISQLTPTLVGAMTDIGETIDSKFDPASLYETTQQIEELSKLLNSIELSGDVTQQEIVADVKNKLALIHPDVYTKVQEKTKCPYCNTDNVVYIGKMHPASQMVACSTCDETFHVHRAQDASITTSKPGRVSGASKINVACRCGAKFTATFKGETEARTCLSCKSSLILHKNGDVTYPDDAVKKEA